MKNVVLAGFARSPFTLANKGALARVRPDDLAAQVVAALVERTRVNPGDIEDLILGCAFPEGEQGLNVAGEVFVAAGVESMSRVPMLGFNPLPNPALESRTPGAYIGMGDTAENVAQQWHIDRGAQEVFAVRSQQRAAAAAKAGRFDAELVPIRGQAGTVESDGCLRPDTTAAALAQLKPAFSLDGTGPPEDLLDLGLLRARPVEFQVHLGEMLLVMGKVQHGLAPLARIRSIAVAGCDPRIMGIGPVAATRKALQRAGLDMEAIGVVELNEAFASQALACVRELGIREETLNIDGGAIALGHPLGATGARIVGKAASLLSRVGARFALATQCIGGGQGIATILERI